MTDMEEKVAEKFKDMEFAPEFVDSVIAKAKEIFFQRRHGYDTKRKRLINQRTAREDRIRTLEERMMEREIDGVSFMRLQEGEKKEILRIEEQLAKLDKGHGVQVDIAKEILRFTENVYDAYQEASPNLKRHYLGFFWQKFEVSDGLIIKSHPSLLFDTLLKLQQATLKKPIAKKANSSVKVITSVPLLRG
jgi:hypothetical protein